MDERLGKIFIISGLLLLVAGIIGGVYLTQQRQIFKSRAFDSQLNIEVISPSPGSRVLGITNIRARAETSEDISLLQAVLKVDGQGEQLLKVEKVAENVILSGKWDSSKSSPGRKNIEIVLYKKIDQQLIQLGSKSVPVIIVTP